MAAGRIRALLVATLAPYHIPHAVMEPALGSIGGALGAAGRVGGPLGTELAHLAKTAFVSGMDLGLEAGAAVAVAGALVALLTLPSRTWADRADRDPGRPVEGIVARALAHDSPPRRTGHSASIRSGSHP